MPRIFTLQGFQFSGNVFQGESPQNIGAVEMRVGVAAGVTTFSYVVLETLPQGPGEVAEISVNETGITGLLLNGAPPAETNVTLGRYTLNLGGGPQVATLMIVQNEGTGVNSVFQIAGPPLPIPTNATELLTMLGAVTAITPIPPGDPMGPGEAISWADLPGIEQAPGALRMAITNNVFFQGTEFDDILIGSPGTDTLVGGAGNDYLVPNGNAGPGLEFIVPGTGSDVIDLSNTTPATVGRIALSYDNLPNGITATLNGAAGTLSIAKGGGDTDQVLGVTNALIAGYNGTGVLFLEGTAHDDTFVLAMATDQWITAVATPGTNSYVLSGAGLVRLDFSLGTQGASVNLATGQILNGGFGNTGTITGSLFELLGTDHGDLLIGNASNNSFIPRGGNDTIDGGGGTANRVRYDGTGVGAMEIDLTQGTASGTFYGVAFTDTLSNIQRARGSFGDDLIIGNTANNLLEGREGNDTLVSGAAGNDTLVGGSGSNTYVIAGTGHVTIMGFQIGLDVIDLRPLNLTQQQAQDAVPYLNNGSLAVDLPGGGSVTLVGHGLDAANQIDLIFADSDILRLGSYYEATPYYGYGVGEGVAGSLTVSNGATFEFLPSGGEGPYVQVGGGPDATGRITVTGTGTQIRAVGPGNQEFSIGRNDGDGTLTLSDGAAFVSTVTGLNRDSFMLVGTEGGNGLVTVDNATLRLEAQQGNAGIRLGMRWTTTEDYIGDGALDVTNGGRVEISASSNGGLWVGGRTGSTGAVSLTGGSELRFDGAGDNSILVGAVPRDVDGGGGQGTLTVTASQISGAQALLLGYNGGTGSALINAGSLVALAGNAANPAAFLGLGVPSDLTLNGATGTATLDGANTLVSLTGNGAVVEIGGENGQGQMDLTDGAELRLTGTDGGAAELVVGARGQGRLNLSGPDTRVTVTDDTDAAGALRIAGENGMGLVSIADDARVTVGTVTVGGHTGLGAIELEDGWLTASMGLTFALNSALLGHGTVIGSIDMNGASLQIGDLFDGIGRPLQTGTGEMFINGDFVVRDGTAGFDIMAAGRDSLTVTGTLSMTGAQIDVDLETGVVLGAEGVRLATAGGGITLDGVSLSAVQGGVALDTARLELRAGDTELWMMPYSTVTLSGTVSIREVNPGSVSLAGTVVTFTTTDDVVHQTTTDTNGAFSFDVAVGAEGTLSLARAYAPPVDKTLSVDDVIALFRVVAGATPVASVGVPGLIAGDFNRDGTTNITDVIDLFHFVAGSPTATHSPHYLFVDLSADAGVPNPGAVPAPGPIMIGALGADTSLSLGGILTGDLNNYV